MKVVPAAAGHLNGAPVLAYVWPTSLEAWAIGIDEVEGTGALAVALHPDFDDTPLWGDRDCFLPA